MSPVPWLNSYCPIKRNDTTSLHRPPLLQVRLPGKSGARSMMNRVNVCKAAALLYWLGFWAQHAKRGLCMSFSLHMFSCLPLVLTAKLFCSQQAHSFTFKCSREGIKTIPHCQLSVGIALVSSLFFVFRHFLNKAYRVSKLKQFLSASFSFNYLSFAWHIYSVSCWSLSLYLVRWHKTDLSFAFLIKSRHL